MDISSLLGTASIVNADNRIASTVASNAAGAAKTGDNVFQTILNTAIDNINTTNSYLSDAENAEISFALGETENTHDLMISLMKASTALQYTVAIRDRFLDAYKEIMQMQI